MRRRTLIGVLVLAIMTLGLPATATIHEIVGAACNGGDPIDPAPLGFSTVGTAGLSGNSPDALAPWGTTLRPLIAADAVDTDTFLTTDSPALKFGEGLFAPTLTLGDLAHPSSDHCKNLNP